MPWRRWPVTSTSTIPSAAAGFLPGILPAGGDSPRIGDLHMPLGWGDIEWEDLFSELTFLPDTVLIMEIGPRYRNEQAECLKRAQGLMLLNGGRTIAAAE